MCVRSLRLTFQEEQGTHASRGNSKCPCRICIASSWPAPARPASICRGLKANSVAAVTRFLCPSLATFARFFTMQSYPSTRANSRVRPAANGNSNGISISTSPVHRINPTDYEATPVGEEAHPAIHVGRTALVTGAASGIGLALSKELAQ